MAGNKRTFSVAFPAEIPPRLKRKSTSTASAARGTIGALSESADPSRSSLRKVSTLTLEEPMDSEETTSRASLSKRSSTSKSRPVSLQKKTSVEKGALVSRLSGLKSGSIIGETTTAEAPTLSKKKSSIKTPSVPSGLTKLALTKTGSRGTLRVSKSQLLDGVDETEMASALESLKSKLSKTGSKTSILSAKSDSVKSVKSPAISRASSKVSAVNDDADEPSASAAAPLLPPGGLMEIVISFDTTGSMYGCLDKIRAKVKDLVQRLQADIPGIRIAIIAHGDYCDASNYIIKWIDFGASIPEICDFVQTVGRTGGGDGPECYELVLLRAREALSWTPGSQRVLVVINDDVPHEPGYRYGGKTYHINWREECAHLKNMGVKVYGVRNGCDRGSKTFNDEMASLTGGKHLDLDDFDSLFDFIMMICYRETNPDMIEVYEAEMRARAGRQGIAMDAARVAKDFKGMSGATPVTFGSSSVTFGSPKKPTAKTAKKLSAKAPKKTAAKASVKGKTGKTSKKTNTGKKGTPTSGKGKKGGKKTSKLLKRERVPDAKLSVGSMKSPVWTKWLLAISPVPVKPKNKSKKSEYDQCPHYPGHRIRYIFGNKSQTEAIYELAVKGPGSKAGKKYPVFFKKTTGYNTKRSWESFLFRNKLVRKEVSMCIAAGCSLWVRQGVPKGRSHAVKTKLVVMMGKSLRKSYDYAWMKYASRKQDGKMCHRQLKIRRRGATAITISHPDL